MLTVSCYVGALPFSLKTRVRESCGWPNIVFSSLGYPVRRELIP